MYMLQSSPKQSILSLRVQVLMTDEWLNRLQQCEHVHGHVALGATAGLTTVTCSGCVAMSVHCISCTIKLTIVDIGRSPISFWYHAGCSAQHYTESTWISGPLPLDLCSCTRPNTTILTIKVKCPKATDAVDYQFSQVHIHTSICKLETNSVSLVRLGRA